MLSFQTSQFLMKYKLLTLVCKYVSHQSSPWQEDIVKINIYLFATRLNIIDWSVIQLLRCAAGLFIFQSVKHAMYYNAESVFIKSHRRFMNALKMDSKFYRLTCCMLIASSVGSKHWRSVLHNLPVVHPLACCRYSVAWLLLQFYALRQRSIINKCDKCVFGVNNHLPDWSLSRI